MSQSKHELITSTEMLPAFLYYHEGAHGAQYIPAHWHHSVELSYTIAGEIDEFFIDGVKMRTAPGTVLVINPMAVHSIYVAPGHEEPKRALTIIYPYTNILKFFPSFDNYQFNINRPERFSTVQQKKYRQLQRMLDEVTKTFVSEDDMRWINLNIQLLSILKLLVMHFTEEKDVNLDYSPVQKNHDRLLQIKNYVQKHYNSDIGLEDIAAITFLSKEYLARFFKTHMGTTVLNYINAVRAREAKKLIVAKHGTFSKIAEDCGFSGLRTMDRALVKNYGMTAREIKAKYGQ